MVNNDRQNLGGKRQLSKLSALKRAILRLTRNFEIDGTDVIATVDRRIEKVAKELERYQELNHASTAKFQALTEVSGLQL